jgi:pilus assembly protein Flp/PilA
MLLQYVQFVLDRFGVEREEEGQGLVEYALIIVLISIAAIVSMQALAGGITGVFDTINSTLGG